MSASYLPCGASCSSGLPGSGREPRLAQQPKLLPLLAGPSEGEVPDPDLFFLTRLPPEEDQRPETQTLEARKACLVRARRGNQMVFLVGKRHTVRTATPAWCQVTVRLNKQSQQLFLHPDQPWAIDNWGERNCLPLSWTLTMTPNPIQEDF